ncbi:hypothetical protein QE152_g14242 [Popillia japonica]|uniref:Uncharacterized protein n=1 Tax=Popillia japonica TaxID=7064 RepID=A0AAW1L7E5_POPJA
MEEASNTLDLRHFTGVAFLHFTSVFGFMWHDRLMFKMWRDGINSELSVLLDFQRYLSWYSLLEPELSRYYTTDIQRYPNTHLAIYADDSTITPRSATMDSYVCVSSAPSTIYIMYVNGLPG